MTIFVLHNCEQILMLHHIRIDTRLSGLNGAVVYIMTPICNRLIHNAGSGECNTLDKHQLLLLSKTDIIYAKASYKWLSTPPPSLILHLHGKTMAMCISTIGNLHRWPVKTGRNFPAFFSTWLECMKCLLIFSLLSGKFPRATPTRPVPYYHAPWRQGTCCICMEVYSPLLSSLRSNCDFFFFFLTRGVTSIVFSTLMLYYAVCILYMAWICTFSGI